MNISSLMDRRGISPFQWRVQILCFLIVALDGLDTAAIGYLAPSIRTEWHMNTAALGPIFGAGLAGLMVGCFLLGPLADRIGRKKVLTLSALLFGLGSLLSASAHDPQQLILLRLLTGLGLGGAMPNAITLSAEYGAARYRSLLVTASFSGFMAGFALGGEIVAQTLPLIGWRGVLIAGGVLPLVFVPVLLAWLPESMRYLAARGDRGDQLLAIARKIDPSVTQIEADAELDAARARGVTGLFSGGYWALTLLLWGAFFCTLFAFYLLTSWMPLIARDAGYSLAEAARVGAMLPLGGIAGSLVIGYAMDRSNPHRVLAVSYVAAGLALCVLGMVTHQFSALMVMAFLTGAGVAGSQTGANALAASMYPTGSRASGVAWALGVGRFGSVLGSSLGGVLIAVSADLTQAFRVVAIPAFAAAVLILAMNHLRRKSRMAAVVTAGAVPGAH
jgi:AAHS family 4-hydroxybenzoate transporter-like MFS transporter